MFRLGSIRFRVSGLPREEWEDAYFLQWQLASLDGYVRRFEYAVQLFQRETETSTEFLAAGGEQIEHPETWARNEQAHQWSHLAARDAALSIFHVHHVLAAIKLNAERTCPSLRPAVNISALERASHEFARFFPSAEMLRHGVAHSAENGADRSKAEFNALKLRDGDRIEDFGGSLAGDFFALTVGGRMRGMMLNAVTLTRLREVTQLVWGAFEGAAELAESLADESERAKAGAP